MFDYLAAGRIILSSKRDGICEILNHNVNAVIVDKYISIAGFTNKNIKTKNNLKKFANFLF